ncbi:MAG: twin-arginine translocase subunit TatC [Candidatus Paceibacterota bacterium]|jgi:sec-independent protein translocase protein TatC
MEDDTNATRLTFWGHVGVLRNYILLGGALYLTVAILSFSYFDEALISLLLKPLNGETLLFLSPLGPFLFKIKIALYAALLASFPVWLGLLLRFVSPVFSTAKRFALSLFAVASLALGAGSLAVAYYYFVPVTLSVLRGFVVTGTENMLTAESYLSFCIMMLAVVFIVLQIPVVMSALSYAGVLNPHALGRHRRAAILTIIIALAIVTPTTDVVTLIIVSIPAILLWELGIAISKLLYMKDKEIIRTSPLS